MNKYITLIEFFEQTRPQIRDISCIYSAVISCIEKGVADRVVLDMDHILYDREGGKVRFTVDRLSQCGIRDYEYGNKSIQNNKARATDLMRNIRACLKYADEQTIEFADRIYYIYTAKGYTECADMLADYQKHLENSCKMLSKNNLIFVSFILIITFVYYKIYGIIFV